MKDLKKIITVLFIPVLICFSSFCTYAKIKPSVAFVPTKHFLVVNMEKQHAAFSDDFTMDLMDDDDLSEENVHHFSALNSIYFSSASKCFSNQDKVVVTNSDTQSFKSDASEHSFLMNFRI